VGNNADNRKKAPAGAALRARAPNVPTTNPALHQHSMPMALEREIKVKIIDEFRVME